METVTIILAASLATNVVQFVQHARWKIRTMKFIAEVDKTMQKIMETMIKDMANAKSSTQEQGEVQPSQNIH